MAARFEGSKFVVTDPGDPDAPRVLAEYQTVPGGHLLAPGVVVTYVNPALPGLGNPGGGPMVVTELILYPGLRERGAALAERPYVEAVCDGGKYAMSADHLVPVEAVRAEGIAGPSAMDAPGLVAPDERLRLVAGSLRQGGRDDVRRQYAAVLDEVARQVAVALDDLETLLVVATMYVDAFGKDELMTLPERMRLQEVEQVLERRGRRY
jgi:hypothetical protein